VCACVCVAGPTAGRAAGAALQQARRRPPPPACDAPPGQRPAALREGVEARGGAAPAGLCSARTPLRRACQKTPSTDTAALLWNVIRASASAGAPAAAASDSEPPGPGSCHGFYCYYSESSATGGRQASKMVVDYAGVADPRVALSKLPYGNVKLKLAEPPGHDSEAETT
jgi:hypothetical protein